MKIIDLLNKIANGEEVPKKIMFRGKVYVWFERNDNIFNYKQEYNGRLLDNYFCDDWFVDSNDILNDEVEIIEEKETKPSEEEIEAFKEQFNTVWNSIKAVLGGILDALQEIDKEELTKKAINELRGKDES